MGLSFIENSYFVTKLIDFPKIRHINVEYFNLVHAHKPTDLDFLAVPKSWVLTKDNG